MNKRVMHVAGSFYPHSFNETQQLISSFHTDQDRIIQDSVMGLIVPHAGYIFSGACADAAYRRVKDVKKVVVFGPSHRVGFEGVSLANYHSYQTPLGDLKIDTTLTQKLLQDHSFCFFDNRVHQEHSTETQFPFIKYYYGDVEVVEAVYGDVTPLQLLQLIEAVANEALVVISSDLSHFYPLQKANELDRICIDAVTNLESKKLDSGCEACGKLGIAALLAYAKKNSLESEVMNYCTSYDKSGDSSSVVGYLSALIKRG